VERNYQYQNEALVEITHQKEEDPTTQVNDTSEIKGMAKTHTQELIHWKAQRKYRIHRIN